MKLKLVIIALMLTRILSNNLNASEMQGSSINVVTKNEKGDAVAGVELKLFNEDGIYIEQGVSDINGQVQFDNLVPGKYSLKETKVPYPYEYYQKVYDLKIRTDGQMINVDNTVSKSDISYISVYQVDGDNDEVYGYEYTIYNRDGDIVEVLTTNKRGHASSSQLDSGMYYITQTKVPPGARIDNRIYKLEVTGQRKYIAYSGISRSVDGSFSFQVVNQEGNGLSDVKYTVYEGTTEISNAASDENGIVTFTNIPYGNYRLEQTYNKLVQYPFAITEEQGEIGIPIQVIINSEDSGSDQYVLTQLADTASLKIWRLIAQAMGLIFIKVGYKYGSNKSFSS